MHEHGGPGLERRLALGRAADEQAIAGSPPDPMRRCHHVGQDQRRVAELPPHACGHRLRHDKVGFPPLEVPPQRLELGRGAAGGDDHRAGADRAMRRDDVGMLASKADLFYGRLFETGGATASGRLCQSQAGAIRIQREAVFHPDAAGRVELHPGVQLLRGLPREMEPRGRACVEFAT